MISRGMIGKSANDMFGHFAEARNESVGAIVRFCNPALSSSPLWNSAGQFRLG